MRIRKEQLSKLRRDRAGAVAVEYAMILVLVAIPTVAGLTAGGVIMINGYRTGRQAMLKPTP